MIVTAPIRGHDGHSIIERLLHRLQIPRVIARVEVVCLSILTQNHVIRLPERDRISERQNIIIYIVALNTCKFGEYLKG